MLQEEKYKISLKFLFKIGSQSQQLTRNNNKHFRDGTRIQQNLKIT